MTGPDSRNAFARLDLAILELEKLQGDALELKRLAREHASRVTDLKIEILSIRKAMRPLLDPDAPAEIR